MFSFVISLTSIVVGLGAILKFHCAATPGSFMFLAIFGAPVTFLYALWALVIGDKPDLLVPAMYFLYFLQWQLVAFGLQKFRNRLTWKKCLAVVGVLLVSAFGTFYFLSGGMLR